MKASEFLKKAQLIMDERGNQYDAPQGERSMGKTVDAFNIITGKSLSEAEGWLLLQLLKDTRQWQRISYHADSAEDCISYAALKAEALARDANVEGLQKSIKQVQLVQPGTCTSGTLMDDEMLARAMVNKNGYATLDKPQKSWLETND